MALVVLLLVLALPAARLTDPPPVFSFERVDGSTVSGAWSSFDPIQGTELASSGGGVSIPPGQLVLVSAKALEGRAAVAPRDILFLAHQEGQAGQSERLVGQLLGGDDVEVRFLIAGGGEVVIPFENIDRLLPAADQALDRLLSLDVEGFDDRVWRRRDDDSLDALAGVVNSVDEKGLLLESALGELRLSWPEVLAMVLADTVPPDGPLSGWPVRLALRSGTVFSAGLLSATPGELLVSTRFAGSLTLPSSQLSSMVFSDRPDQPALLLAGLSPISVDEWPALGRGEPTLFPWQRDLSVAGGMLKVGGLMGVSGLGVHANSALVFEVPAGARTLRVSAGLSDDILDLPARGSVSFFITSEGRALASVDRLDEGQQPVVLHLKGLEQGQLLRFDVGAGGDQGAGDRAVWLEGVFGR